MNEGLFTLGQMAEKLSLTLRGCDRGVSRVILDSRNICENDLFICLKGEVTDGHNYVSAAASSVSCASLVSGVWYDAHKEEADTLSSIYDHSFLVCSDTLRTLQDMSEIYLKRFDLVKIALTGSNGKTTTKDILASILGKHEATHCNPGNFNSETGLPLSLFMLKPHHRYLIAEMGMNHAGEITRLADIVRPDFALITNIGAAHIGLMGSEQAIAQEKREIFHFFDGNQTAFIPSEDNWSEYLAKDVRGKVVSYGWSASDSLSFTLGEKQSLVVNYKGTEVKTALSGSVNFKNVCAAVALAEALGVSTENIHSGLGDIQVAENRNQFFNGRISVLSDCYNANAESLESGLDILKGITDSSRKIVVLGDMKELGGYSSEVHTKAGEMVFALNPDAVFLLGDDSRVTGERLSALGYSGFLNHCDEFESLSESLLGFISDNDLVYLKGSHSLALERLIPLFRDEGWVG